MKQYRFFIVTILLVFGVQAFAYFIAKQFITDYNLIGSIHDTKIPVINEFIYFYNIWYPFEIFTLYFIFKKNKDSYIKIIMTLIICLITANLCYWFYPTMVARPILNTYSNLTEFLVWFTYSTDTPVNCFPSVHCIICFIVIFGTFENKLLNIYHRLFIYFVNVMIIFSTLFVKQHVLIDVWGALFIAVLAYYLVSRLNLFNKIKKKLLSYT